MIRSAFRLAIIFFAVWVLSTQWEGANRLFRSFVNVGLSLAPASAPTVPSVVSTFLALSLVVHLVLTPLWFAWVPLNRVVGAKGGPTRHPFPPQPMRILLRVRRSRFLAAFVLEMLGLALTLRTLEAVVEPAAVRAASGLPAGASHELWAIYALGFASGLGLAWLGLWLAARFTVYRDGVGYGFVQYQLESLPIARMLTRVVMFAVFPLAAVAGTSHSHPLHGWVVLAWMVGLVGAAMLAQFVTLIVERRSDAWLAQIGSQIGSEVGSQQNPSMTNALEHGDEAAAVWHRTLLFLHPSRPVPPWSRPLARPAPGAGLDDPRASRGLGQFPDADLARAGGEAAVERARPASGKGGRARSALRVAMSVGTASETALAEAEPHSPPAIRWGMRGFVGLVAAGVTGLVVTVVWQWVTLPSAEGTRRLARSAHIHVRKTTENAVPRVVLLGTRFDYSLNSRMGNVSPHFVHAVLASEDHRFFDHGPGYKIAKFVQAGVVCALRKLNVFSPPGGCRGNSTLGQQLARNLFLSEERTIGRKLKELVWALKMEWGFSKDEILELYVNRVYLGRGNFGVEMASRSYFKKSANQLSASEAAVIAAAIKRPGWNWTQDRPAALARAALIYSLMRRHGYLPAEGVFPARFVPELGQRALHKPYLGHLWQWVRGEIAGALKTLPDGNYKALTSLDAEVEIYAERRLAAEVQRLQGNGVPVSQGAVVIMRPTGEVLAMVGGVGSDTRGPWL